MKQISVSKIVKFRRISEKSRRAFVNNLKKPKEKSDKSGGDYWIMASSAISNCFRDEDMNLISEKIEEITEKKEAAEARISRNMYQRNIDILKDFVNFSFSQLKPNSEIEYLTKSQNSSVLKIRGLPILIRPQHIFKYNENDKEKIGGIWFVAKLNGYSTHELLLFTDALFRYLKYNYSTEYELDTEHCTALDLTTQKRFSYYQIENNELSSPLNSTLDEIRKLM